MSGAGVLPFCVQNGEVYFLFHRTFVGKKVGYLIDFGGGVGKQDKSNFDATAAREFNEETGGFS